DDHRPPVVNGLAVDTVAHFYQFAVRGDRIADLNILLHLFFGSPKIDKVIGGLWHLCSFLRRHHMDGLAAHYTHQILGTMYNHPLSGQGLRIKSSQCMEPHKSIIINVGDDEADLVHMGGHHYPLSLSIISPLFYGDDIAKVVNTHFID